MSATTELPDRQRVLRRTVPVKPREWRPSDLGKVVRLTIDRWNEDRVPKLAAALAYYTSFAVAPVLLIAIAVAGMAFGADAARGAISREISGLVGPKIGEGIESLLKSAWQPRTGILASLLGVVALFFGASGVFIELQDSLNIIWKVKRKAGRGIWGTIRDRFLSFSMVAGIGFLLLVSLVLSAGLESLGKALSGEVGPATVVRILNPAVSLAVISALFAASFKVLPDARTRWRDVVVGAFLTGLLFTLGKFLIGMYLGRNTIGSTYGAAGSFVLLLLWIYYSSQIFFLGAEFTKAWADTHGMPPAPDADAVAAQVPQPRGSERTEKAGTRWASLWHRRGRRIGIIAGGALLLLPLLFMAGMLIGVNPIVKRVVQNLGTTALEVPVRIDRARLSFLGRARLDGIRIANPPEYEEFEAVTIQGLYARVPLWEAFRKDIDIPELRVVRPVFSFELGRGELPSNWGRLMKNLSDSLPKKGESGAPSDGDRTFRISTLRIVEPVVKFRAPGITDGVTLHLNDIELKNAGTAPGTRSKTYVILASLLQALLTGGLKEGKDLPSDVRGPLQRELSGAVKTFGEVLKPEK